MKTYKYITVAAVSALALTACSEQDDVMYGEGRVMLNTSINTDMKIMSRADNEALTNELGESLQLWISNSKGVIRQYNGIDEVPAELTLQSGAYTVEAWAGDSVSASWDKRWFKAVVPFNVEKDQTASVNVVCKIANVAVEVNYNDDVKAALTDYSLTVNHSRGKLVFENETNDATGYFMMPQADNNLSYTLTGTKNDGTVFTRTGYLCSEGASVKPGYKYIINVSCSQQPEDEVGGGFLNIVIDETENTVGDSVTLFAPPSVAGYNFDITQPLRCIPGNVGRRSVYVTASTSLTSAVVECQGLGTMLGIGGDDVDVYRMYLDGGSTLTAVENGGINANYTVKDNGTSNLKINFEKAFTDNFSNEGTYPIKITVTDANGKTTEATLELVLSEAPLATAAPTEVRLYEATLAGEVVKADGLDVSTVHFKYRAKGDSDWTTAAATVSGTAISGVTGRLKQNTEYEYCVASDMFTADVMTFTTGADTQLPNAGFEGWQTSSSPYLVYAAGDDMFWDSGNHGSATMKKNVTVPTTSIKHSGNYGISLESQFVGIGAIGKFAAGNVFIGKYLATDGTDGVLGFGRPFTSEGKVVALHGWVKYTPGTVQYTDSNVPDIVSGQPDKGIIYVALLDGTTDSEYPDFPVVIKTKAANRQLFSSDAANVVAYGQMVFSEATAGSGMVEFTIPLSYSGARDQSDVKFIMLTASASKGGDYFCGGNSVMVLDDLELIYE